MNMFDGYRILLARINRLDKKVDGLYDLVNQVLFVLRQPGVVSFKALEETDMGIRFGITLPVRPELDKDWDEIASGVLQVVVGDGAPVVVETTKEDQLTEERLIENAAFVGDQGVAVEAKFNYIDDARNAGAVESLVFELKDTVPPVAPSALGAVMLEEV